MFRLTVRDDFASAHQLREYQGQCENLHGHNWKVEAVVEGKGLDSAGLLLDFKDLKKALKEVLQELDHSFLNQHPFFQERNPTSENLAFFIFKRLEKALRTYPGIRVKSVTVWESERAGATYLE
jgi:6-pyruvoyltetrahydropterin/6-carboxytetrahydropterin synthase